MEKLFDTSKRLIDNTDTRFIRYKYYRINWDAKMIGLTGPRGIGKTTMLLQYIKNNLNTQETLYVTTEDFYFSENKLVDLADQFVKFGGKHLFIDEIHKFHNWSKELKLIYDYHPKLKVVFTGSSILDIKTGSADLSRRAVMHNMQGLSFREYLQLFHDIDITTYSLSEILQHKVKVSNLEHPLALFKEYLKNGYYPFAKETEFCTRLNQIINQTLETDIPFYAGMNVATGRKLKQLLSIISRSVPFKPNYSKIAKMLQVSRNNVSDYCIYIEEAGMIAQLRNAATGIGGLGKVEKIFLDNTNLIFNLAGDTSNTGNIRETFFLNQLRVNHGISTSPVSDFLVDEYTFEVGSKNKSKKQIMDIPYGFVVKDDIEYGMGNIIPLWQFGLMY